MENQVNQANSKNTILNYGGIYGLIIVFVSLVAYAMGKHLDPSVAMISLLITAIAIIGSIVLGIRKFKIQNNGFLTFGQAIKIGVGIAILGTLIVIIYQQIFTNVIEPDFMQQALDRTEESLIDAGLSDEQIETQLAIQEKMSGPLISSAMGILFWAFIGFVISAIAGAVMQKKEEDTF
ncbi:DUF4199 domain-containing protein [Tenacibaculum sp. M341]|uniref:DUF4199 domain-containing protein n=1 Tax=Tenacibaculum sp. M341 TaxID=2530339 RepID=UPI001044FCA5|nr:DUF4199 domain-containing protein [Tenacibaculum sp. M341]TCI94958.1 DUF4199 domain-containing protein [Tenacibaculum sp. M341]